MGPADTDIHTPLRIVRPDAEVAVLLLHGITGSPFVWKELARSVAEELPVTVSVPLLPGHGTRWQDLARRGYDDWYFHAREELERLRASHERVVVAGLSMGGALALDLAARTDAVDALVLVNPAVFVDDPLAFALPVLGRLVPSVRAIGNDIALPGVTEHAYARTPVRAVASLHRAQRGLRERLWAVEAPVTLCLSSTDNVVGPRSAAYLRSHLPRRPREIVLRRSRHVATLDHDAAAIGDALRAAVGNDPQPDATVVPHHHDGRSPAQ